MQLPKFAPTLRDMADLATLVGETMLELTASERVTLLEHIRAKAEVAMATAGGETPVVEYEIRNRRTRYEVTSEWLAELDARIAVAHREANRAQGNRRNRAVLRRRP